MLDKTITATEVAKILGIDRRTVTRLAQNGEIPAIKVGLRWRFNLATVLDWKRQRELANE